MTEKNYTYEEAKQAMGRGELVDGLTFSGSWVEYRYRGHFQWRIRSSDYDSWRELDGFWIDDAGRVTVTAAREFCVSGISPNGLRWLHEGLTPAGEKTINELAARWESRRPKKLTNLERVKAAVQLPELCSISQNNDGTFMLIFENPADKRSGRYHLMVPHDRVTRECYEAAIKCYDVLHPEEKP